jgi:hypothetical protein
LDAFMAAEINPEVARAEAAEKAARAKAGAVVFHAALTLFHALFWAL